MDFIFKWIIFFISCWVRIITTLTRPLSEYVLNILYWIVLGRTKRLPAIDNKILLMSARELAAKIRNRELRAEDVMSAYIERCKSIHPLINAAVGQRFSQALIDAIAVDDMLDQTPVNLAELAMDKPLLGVPFTCKESIGVQGLAQTQGAVKYKDLKASFDGNPTALYRKAGAIPVVVTNGPEYSMWWETANLVFGWTKNPYDNRRTVGGSSGGEGAIITSCGAVIGIGSDLGGGIRIPSCFCGIYGHKPSKGLISNNTSWLNIDQDNADPLVGTGPMCRYVEDLPMLTWLLAGDNGHRINLHDRVDFRKVSVFYMEEFPGRLLSATNDIKAAVRKAAAHFQAEYGITPTKLQVPELKYAFYIWECMMLQLGCRSFKEMLASENGKISITWEFIKSIFRKSDHTWPALYLAAVQRRSENGFYKKCLYMYKKLLRKFGAVLRAETILLVPTSPDPPPHYLMTIPKYRNIAYTCIFNALGYPSSQVPTGLSAGVPIGIQVVSRHGKDNLTLAAAVELDKVFNGWINPSPVTI